MTEDQLQALFDRHLAAWKDRDPVKLAAQHALDGKISSPMFATVRGRAAIEESYRSLFTSFPDWEFVADAVLFDAPRIAHFLTVNATHTNDFFGLPGTHRHFELHAARVMTVEDELITDERRIYDFTGLLVQLGVLRAKPAKP